MKVRSILLIVTSACAVDYMYLSDNETTVFGDRIRWWHEDTVGTAIRTNDCFAIMENPVFYGPVIQAGENCDCCDPPCVCGVPPYPFPETADWLRGLALHEMSEPDTVWWANYYFDQGANDQAFVKITPEYLHIWWGVWGIPVDTVFGIDEIRSLNSYRHVIYFDCPIRISGVVGGYLIIASSGTIGIADNIVYESSTMPYGIPTPGHSERFALVAEGNIKILNNPFNGRENCSGFGPGGTNDPDLKDVALNGYYVALNQSFTFEQQNDCVDSAYCGPTPDERGTIRLWGALAHKRRGYVHRSNHGGTGYAKQYRWDPELADFDAGVFNHTANRFTPDSLVFGDVAVGDSLWDTLFVDNYRQAVGLAAVLTSPPFHTPPVSYEYGQHFAFPVRFAPQNVGTFYGNISMNIAGDYYQVPITGRGISGGSAIPEPSVYPNPFNNTATISFLLPVGSDVRVDVFDVLGRHVQTLLDGQREAGLQRVNIDGRRLASGVYFVHLNTPAQHFTRKILLIK